MTNPRGLVSTALRAVVTFVGGTLLLGVVGNAVTASYAERNEALELKTDLTKRIVELTGQEANALVVLVQNLAPSAQLNARCHSATGLPSVLAARRDIICADAALQEILEEQTRSLELRETHMQALALAKSVESAMTDDDPAREYNRLLLALEHARKLNSSTTCGADRRERAESLESAYAWVESSHVSALAGPPNDTVPCDDHGPQFAVSLQFIAEGLVFEASVVAAEIRGSRVEGLRDSPGDLLGGLVRDPLVVAGVAVVLLFAIAAWALRSRAS